MAKDLNINMLPKQYRFYKELLSGTHSVIGIGGGRGSSKSSCLDIATITLMSEILVRESTDLSI